MKYEKQTQIEMSRKQTYENMCRVYYLRLPTVLFVLVNYLVWVIIIDNDLSFLLVAIGNEQKTDKNYTNNLITNNDIRKQTKRRKKDRE